VAFDLSAGSRVKAHPYSNVNGFVYVMMMMYDVVNEILNVNGYAYVMMMMNDDVNEILNANRNVCENLIDVSNNVGTDDGNVIVFLH